MKRVTIIILQCLLLVSINTFAQFFKPLDLGIETTRGMVAEWFQPQMHIEGDILYVCTAKGLYSKDLSNSNSPWQLAGFKDIPLQDYVRNGDDMLAMRHCFYDHIAFTLLSHDGGKTYEDTTPDYFKGKDNSFVCFDQHPTDPNTLLAFSCPDGSLYLTHDFGKTWKKVSDMVKPKEDLPHNYMGFHPANPDIIYVSGAIGDEQAAVQISYDEGSTWQKKLPYTEWVFNQFFRIAFHPTNQNKWIAGGEHCVYTTNDNGQTWNTQYLPNDDAAYRAKWRCVEYDNTNAEIVYMAGHKGQYLCVVCSTDGGKTWNKPYSIASTTDTSEYLFDLEPYGSNLLVYSLSGVYEISKADLLDQTNSIQRFTAKAIENSLYDLQGRQLQREPTHGVFIKDGRKWAK